MGMDPGSGSGIHFACKWSQVQSLVSSIRGFKVLRKTSLDYPIQLQKRVLTLNFHCCHQVLYKTGKPSKLELPQKHSLFKTGVSIIFCSSGNISIVPKDIRHIIKVQFTCTFTNAMSAVTCQLCPSGIYISQTGESLCKRINGH